MILPIWGIITGFIAAASGALAAYDGWNNLGFVAGEIKDPKKNIPRGLLIGLGICILMYVLTTLAYLYALPIDEMSKSSLLASDALTASVGVLGGGFIALLVMVSTAGATNGNILPCARITFAMANERNFSHRPAKYIRDFLHPEMLSGCRKSGRQFLFCRAHLICLPICSCLLPGSSMALRRMEFLF